MLKLLPFAFVIATVAAAADPSPALDCLSHPVTIGNVTLTCSAIDNTAYPDTGMPTGDYVGAASYVIQLRANSTDPDVNAMRFNLTWQPYPGQLPAATRSAIVVKTGTAFAYTFTLSPSYVLNTDGVTYSPARFSITAIQVQELKVATSQTFTGAGSAPSEQQRVKK